MIPLPSQVRRHQPVVTWTLVALNVLIYLWDRRLALGGPPVIFSDLMMRPNEVVEALTGQGERFSLVTVFTAMFLHGNLYHLVGNLLYLLTFGESVEEALGPWRYTVYYLFWGFVATAAHIFVDPSSTTPTLGASGAIGGVLGSFFLLFPAKRIELFLFVTTVIVDAWKLLGLWFLFQILLPQDGVANWAHAGGFMAGMLTVLIVGGRAKILKGREHEFEDDYEDEP
jgi:membrane associated rhomboid family serine protease